MCWHIANSSHKNLFVPIGCGGGKSLAWLLRTICLLQKGYDPGLTIIILPYKFLTSHHFQSALVLASKFKRLHLRIEMLTLVSINADFLPTCLCDQKNLPHLLFVSIDAMARLLEHHISNLKDFAMKKLLVRIIIDEVHTFITEIGYRRCIEVHRQLPRLGVMLIMMSATVPHTKKNSNSFI
jgi:CRISPR/Cas system-associated endonuclease/helicase Cas3